MNGFEFGMGIVFVYDVIIQLGFVVSVMVR
jgi:hypothetical protein